MAIEKLQSYRSRNQRPARSKSSDRERGYILVILAILIGVLLSFAGLAIDTGRLYQAKTRVERAARAAAVAAVGFRSQKGWFYVYDGPTATGPIWTGTTRKLKGANTREKELKLKAYRVLTENLRAAGLEVAHLSQPTASCSPGVFDPSFDDTDWSTVGGCDFSGINYDSETDTVTVDVTYDAPTFLAGRVPIVNLNGCNNGRCRMSFSAQAQLQPAAIAFIPDVSGSMRCAAESDNPEECDTAAVSPNRKIDKLVDAAQAFYKMFNPWQDRIAVIPFNLVAAPDTAGLSADASTSFGNDEARWIAFRDLLTSDPPSVTATRGTEGLQPKSNTNHCDALWEARTRMAGVNVPSGEVFYVFFTDGAPTAGRMDPVQIQSSKVDKAFDDMGLNSSGQESDFFFYSVEWRDTSTNPPTIYTGPSPLIHNTRGGGAGYPNARAALYGYEIGSSNKGQIFPMKNDDDPAVVPITHKNNFNDRDKFSDKTKFREILSHAIGNNLGFVMPGQGHPSSPNPDNTNSADIDINDVDPIPVGGNAPYYQQLFYHCTLEAAQAIRTSNGTIFAIGLGEPLSQEAFRDEDDDTRGDPYGDHLNQWARKDGYFRGVAKDFEASGDFSFSTPDDNRNTHTIKIKKKYEHPVTHVLVDNPHSHRVDKGADPATELEFAVGFKRGNAMLSGGRSGSYFGTNNASELKEIFIGIAKQIQARVGA